MKIESIDKNLKVETSLPVKELTWLSPLDKPLSLHGIHSYDKERGYLRMPVEVSSKVSPGVDWLARNTAGGRVRFKTNSRHIAVKIVSTPAGIMSHITAVGQAGADLYQTEDHRSVYLQSFLPYFGKEPGFASLAYVSGKMTTYTINLPLYSDVKEFYVGLDPDAEVAEPDPYAIEQPVLYYGSSITQGGCASRPGNAYQAMISRRFDCDFLNLGFSGSAKGEPAMADYLASLNPSVFVLDYDHNTPNAAHLKATHEPLFLKFRAAHPETPVVMVTKPDFHPGTEDEARREVILDTYRHAKAAGDRFVWFVDGASLFDGPCRDSCTVDGCHPNDLGFFRMAQGIGETLSEIFDSLPSANR